MLYSQLLGNRSAATVCVHVPCKALCACVLRVKPLNNTTDTEHAHIRPLSTCSCRLVTPTIYIARYNPKCTTRKLGPSPGPNPILSIYSAGVYICLFQRFLVCYWVRLVLITTNLALTLAEYITALFPGSSVAPVGLTNIQKVLDCFTQQYIHVI